MDISPATLAGLMHVLLMLVESVTFHFTLNSIIPASPFSEMGLAAAFQVAICGQWKSSNLGGRLEKGRGSEEEGRRELEPQGRQGGY